MFNHILIPVAPSTLGAYDPAIKAAEKLLGPGGKVSAISIIEELPNYAGAYIPQDYTADHKADVDARIADQFKETSVETHTVIGHASNSILSWAQDHDVDCIVILSHKPGISDYFLGSTAARVVRHAQCPVMVLR